MSLVLSFASGLFKTALRCLAFTLCFTGNQPVVSVRSRGQAPSCEITKSYFFSHLTGFSYLCQLGHSACQK